MSSFDVNLEAIDFDSFVCVIRSRLQRVLVAKYGVNIGVDLTAEVEAWAWENFDQLRALNNPLGYLYRVAQSKARPHLRWNARSVFAETMAVVVTHDESLTEMHDQLLALTANQRICVLLVHAYGWTYREVARVLDISTAAVGNHVTRALARLRVQTSDANDPLLTISEKENSHD